MAHVLAHLVEPDTCMFCVCMRVHGVRVPCGLHVLLEELGPSFHMLSLMAALGGGVIPGARAAPGMGQGWDDSFAEAV